jgi:Putative adhesin
METFDTPVPIEVTFELAVGDIQIAAADRADTVVDVQPSDAAKPSDVSAARETRVGYANGSLSVAGPKGWRHWRSRGGEGSIDVRIELPNGSSVRGSAGVATVRGTGRLGEFRFRTGVGNITLAEAGPVDVKAGAGDVSVDAVAGRVDVHTAGHVRIGRIDGAVVIKNSNGETSIGEVAGDARVSAANGSISIEVARAGVVAKTANGGVRLDEATHGPIVAETAFGTLEIGVPAGVPAWLELETKFGTVRNELDDADRPEPDEDSVEVHARTAMGDITVRRAVGSAA